MIYQSKSHANEVLHMFLALFEKKFFFDYLTLKLTFCDWRWPWIMTFDSAPWLHCHSSFLTPPECSPTLKNMDYRQKSWFKCKFNFGQLRRVLQIFTANGGHLGFSDFYWPEFDRLFLVIHYFQSDRKTVEKPFYLNFLGVWVVIFIYLRFYSDQGIKWHSDTTHSNLFFFFVPKWPTPTAHSYRLGNITWRYQVRIPVGPDICHRSCAYTVLQTVQRHGVYSAASGIVHYKEPLKSFEMRVGPTFISGFLLSRYCLNVQKAT